MASEIRVDKINSLSGVGTVTLTPTRLDIAGITTVATLRATTGIVTSLTAVSSAKVGSGVTLSPDGDIFATGVTTSTTFVGALTGNVTGNVTGTASANAVLTGSTNNTLVTVTGSNAITGESTLTYNPSILTITNASGSSEITLVTPSANDSGIYFNDGSNDGAVIYDHSTQNMDFRANSQTKLRIEGTTKKLLIQRAPSSDVDITVARAQRWGYSDSYQGLIIGNPAVGTMSSLFLNYDPSSNTSGSFAGDGREMVVRKNAKMIVPNAADNTFYNAIEFNAGGDRDDGVTRFRQGIIVSNDSADANVLEDYEEGTFTPQILASSSNPSMSYTSQTGRYTKIGNLVSLSVDVRWSGVSGGGGNARLGGLPFSSNSTSHPYSGAVIIEKNKITTHADEAIMSVEVGSSASFGSFLSTVHDSSDPSSGLTIGNFQNASGYLMVSFHYFTN